MSLKMEGASTCPANASNLLYDTACLQVHNDMNYSVNVYSVSSECVQCEASLWATLPSQTSQSLVVSAVHSISLSAVKLDDNETLCQQTATFAQHEVAAWKIQEPNCTFSTLEPGNNPFIPLYMFVTCVVSVWLLFIISKALCSLPCARRLRNFFYHDPQMDFENDLGNLSSSTDSLPLVQSELVPLRRMSRPRILALDTFRGLTISLMIFVNYGGGKYWFFEHAAWNGLTVADLVFPWFAWVMGVSLVLSYRSKLRSCASRWTVFKVAVTRACKLVLLGLLLNFYNSNDLTTARFCGVLQRLGVAHLIVSITEILFMEKQPVFQRWRWLPLSEMADTWRQCMVILALVSIQVSVTFRQPVPGCPTGYLGPGGAAHHSNCTGGAARFLDSLVFGDRHLYQHSRVAKVYHTSVPFDPEGLLGTLTTCLTVYLGVQAGYIILSYHSTVQRTARWLFWALLTGVVAGCLCGWSQEGGLIPVNKQLWSLSYTLLTSSLAFLLFTVLFVVIDHFHLSSGSLFRIAGMNAILLYIGHTLFKKTFPWSWKPFNVTNHSELFTMNIVAVLLWLVIAKKLHDHEIYLTL